MSSLSWLFSGFDAFLCFDDRWFESFVVKNYLEETFVLTVFWVEYFTFFWSTNLLLTLSKNFKEWDFTRTIEEFGLDIEDINC
jgi:hypothetical protein